MNSSENTAKICTALIEFHKLVGKIGKGEVNPFFKSKYASLSNILSAIQEPLNQSGLAVLQLPHGDGLTTRLVHTSGEYFEATFTMPVAKQNDPQALGSAITYARRYAIGAVLCLNIDEDDDGNKAAAKPTPPKVQAKRPPVKKATDIKGVIREKLKNQKLGQTSKEILTLLVSNDQLTTQQIETSYKNLTTDCKTEADAKALKEAVEFMCKFEK